MSLDYSMDWNIELDRLAALLPSSRANLRRLSVLLDSGEQPKIAVFGKYNHGKSTLLNALIGKEVFKVADKRETITVNEYMHEDVLWIDTPGLDADVNGEDDRRAMTAALESADILCLVHNVKAGELDRSEMHLYQQLMRQDSNYRSKLMLVLTQIDQVSAAELEQVVTVIRSQLPDLKIAEVSAQRYTRGIVENKIGFVKASRMIEFQDYLQSLKDEVADLRQKEALRLIRKARVELTELINDRRNARESAISNIKQYSEEFWSDMKNAHEKIVNRASTLDLI